MNLKNDWLEERVEWFASWLDEWQRVCTQHKHKHNAISCHSIEMEYFTPKWHLQIESILMNQIQLVNVKWKPHGENPIGYSSHPKIHSMNVEWDGRTFVDFMKTSTVNASNEGFSMHIRVIDIQPESKRVSHVQNGWKSYSISLTRTLWVNNSLYSKYFVFLLTSIMNYIRVFIISYQIKENCLFC